MAIDKALINMIITDLQPVSIVQDKGFIDFLTVLDPKYTAPSRRTLMHNQLPQLYISRQELLLQELALINYCCLTTDLWTSRATQGYLTVTCHYINENMEMKSAILSTYHVEESHTADNLLPILKNITDKWNVTSKVHCVVTDSGSNIKKAVRLSGWNHLACFAHLLNLVVTDAIKDDNELADLIEKVKAIVTFFHRSSKACDNLAVNQNRLNLPNHKLIQQVETRWNSVYYMLDRYLEQEEAIKTTLCLLDKNNLIIPSEKSALIKEAVTVLKPFEAVTTEMSAEKNITAFKVIPLSRGLQQLAVFHSNVLGVNLTNHMGNRFPLGMEENYLIGIPTLLDPRFKKAAFTNRSATEKMSRALLNEVVALYQRPQVPDTGSPTSNEPTAPALNGHDGSSCDTDSASVWQFFDQQVIDISSQQTSSTSAFMELDQYFKAPIIPRQEDPLQWWRNNKHIYPNVAKVARKYLATSVPSERLFSKAGELVLQKRSSIKPKNVDMMLFLNSS